MTNSINMQSSSQALNDSDTITITGGVTSPSSWGWSTSLGASPTYTVTSGTSGALLGATGAVGSSNISWLSDSITLSNNLYGAELEVKGDANFEGDIKVKGKSIVDSLEQIEARLAILRPNDELEEKWEQLRGLRQAYIELEAEIKEKEKVWSILKK